LISSCPSRSEDSAKKRRNRLPGLNSGHDFLPIRLAKASNARYAGGKTTIKGAEADTMIHPSLIAIAAIVIVFGILNLIEFKRLD
jgi:hypothetical protein